MEKECIRQHIENDSICDGLVQPLQASVNDTKIGASHTTHAALAKGACSKDIG